MIEFEGLLELAKMGDKEALMKLIEMYRPLLISHSMICGRFDEDLYYEQVHTMIRCVYKFSK
ncbi:helix-turn-helix domain-containing protein [Enterocloster clostridioformis]|uniref:helix-turn-helix domain-containing protein n=1 Tax=Enterocloster clostridioformis TaxID=1531 RepID=UPI0026765A6E|nr:helix-turn-helix domain-containing protein [Enterocloster clostridioformis]